MVDTHCHITSEYYEDINEVINKMKDNIIIVSGTNKDDIKEVIELCKYKNKWWNRMLLCGQSDYC